MSRYIADVHTHSRCSPDANYSMSEMAEAAVMAGLDEICFTDHVDLRSWRDYVPPERFDWTPMVEEYRRAVDQWGHRIKIRLGAEMGELCTDFAKAERYQEDMPPIDFIIGSLHVMSGRFGYRDFTHVDEVADQFDEAVADYLAEELTHVEWGRFSVVGHLTLPLRYANERYHMDRSFAGHMEAVEQVLRAVVDKGLGIECNTNRGGMFLPDGDILRLYRRLGGEIVTLGSDAHRPSHVALGIREGMELLHACGFRYYCTFQQMKPEFHPL